MKETKNTTWKQKLESEQQLKNYVKRVFKDAKKHHYSHSHILSLIKTNVYDKQKYNTLPNYVKSNINGYIQANFDLMYDFLDWAHWYDGKFVGKNLSDYYGDKYIQDNAEGFHVYKNTQKIY